MIEGLMQGLATVFSVKMMLMVIGGCLIGTFIGMLPGLGPMSIIAIMIPIAINLGDPISGTDFVGRGILRRYFWWFNLINSNKCPRRGVYGCQ